MCIKGYCFAYIYRQTLTQLIFTIKSNNMDNLVTIKLNNPDEVEIKDEVINHFRRNFLKKELSSTKVKGNITKNDKLEFRGYFVSRMDLMQMLSDISKDIVLPDKTSLQAFLTKVMINPAVKDSGNKNIGIGINFGYGFSKQINDEKGETILPTSQELQLVFDVRGVSEKGMPSKIVSCYTTANLNPIDPPVNPPNGGTPYPDPRNI